MSATLSLLGTRELSSATESRAHAQRAADEAARCDNRADMFAADHGYMSVEAREERALSRFYREQQERHMLAADRCEARERLLCAPSQGAGFPDGDLRFSAH